MHRLPLLSTLLVMLLTISACSGGNSPSPGPDGSGAGANDPAPELDLKGIQNSDYSLKTILDFANSEDSITVVFEGTPSEYEVRRLNFYFADQQSITEAEANTLPSSCSLAVETAKTTQKSDIVFQSGSLNFVQTQHSKLNSDYAVTVFLQAARFQQFMVICKNTPDTNAIEAHLGHILEVTP